MKGISQLALWQHLGRGTSQCKAGPAKEKGGDWERRMDSEFTGLSDKCQR